MLFWSWKVNTDEDVGEKFTRMSVNLHCLSNCLKLDRVKRFEMWCNKFGKRYTELMPKVFPSADNDPVKELLRKWKKQQIDLFEKALPGNSQSH